MMDMLEKEGLIKMVDKIISEKVDLDKVVDKIILEEVNCYLQDKTRNESTVLSEGIAGPEVLEKNGLHIEYTPASSGAISVSLKTKVGDEVGYIGTRLIQPKFEVGQCLAPGSSKTFQVTHSKIVQKFRSLGLGALMYDILLEAAGRDGAKH